MSRNRSNLTATAGEHFVVYRISCLGLIAALPRAGAMGVDVLVTNNDGSKSLNIQVKTTDYATRTRGRGQNKKPFELQFPLGLKSAKLNHPNLIFAFVDLQGTGNFDLSPDIYLIPSTTVHKWCRDWCDAVKLVRLHRPIAEMEPYKNNWNLITDAIDA